MTPAAVPGMWCRVERSSSGGTNAPRDPDAVHPHLGLGPPSGAAEEKRTGRKRRKKRELSPGIVRQEASLRLLQRLPLAL